MSPWKEAASHVVGEDSKEVWIFYDVAKFKAIFYIISALLSAHHSRTNVITSTAKLHFSVESVNNDDNDKA